jgi:diguanylate cyclase (GGDEF)-like protein
VKILIADDDVVSRLVLTGVLQKFGHEVVATVDGAEAWEVMQQPDAPRMAVLDWVMPGLSGVEVCRRIRGLQSDQPPYVIILTSMGEKADIVTGFDAGADDYLAKPFDPGELHARVDVGRRMIEMQARLIEARDALAYEAMHDSLTGALNRRAFAEVLTRELSRDGRHHHGLALGICDVDEFKRINDTYGHQVGDEVLCGLVRLLETNLRGHDVLGRIGGDEFMMLTEHHRKEDVGLLYERARATVAHTPMPTSAGNVSMTISIGVSIRGADETADQLFATADLALYRAKDGGRNRVCLAAEPTPPSAPREPEQPAAPLVGEMASAADGQPSAAGGSPAA